LLKFVLLFFFPLRGNLFTFSFCVFTPPLLGICAYIGVPQPLDFFYLLLFPPWPSCEHPALFLPSLGTPPFLPHGRLFLFLASPIYVPNLCFFVDPPFGRDIVMVNFPPPLCVECSPRFPSRLFPRPLFFSILTDAPHNKVWC